MPAMRSDQFFKPKNSNKRQIRSKQFENCEKSNIVERSVTNNSRSFQVPRSYAEQYRNSFFVKTIEDWNHLGEESVKAASVETFKNSLRI